MARIVINPTTFKNRKDALCVAFNEGFRIIMEQTAFSPVSEPTKEQRRFFSDTAYADDEVQLRRTIIARVCTLDTSVPRPTDAQLQESVEFLHTVLEIGACRNDWEQKCVQKLVDLVAAVPVRTGGAKKPEKGGANQGAGAGNALTQRDADANAVVQTFLDEPAPMHGGRFTRREIYRQIRGTLTEQEKLDLGGRMMSDAKNRASVEFAKRQVEANRPAKGQERYDELSRKTLADIEKSHPQFSTDDFLRQRTTYDPGKEARRQRDEEAFNRQTVETAARARAEEAAARKPLDTPYEQARKAEEAAKAAKPKPVDKTDPNYRYTHMDKKVIDPFGLVTGKSGAYMVDGETGEKRAITEQDRRDQAEVMKQTGADQVEAKRIDLLRGKADTVKYYGP